MLYARRGENRQGCLLSAATIVVSIIVSDHMKTRLYNCNLLDRWINESLRVTFAYNHYEW